jgi:hypothetical protein
MVQLPFNVARCKTEAKQGSRDPPAIRSKKAATWTTKMPGDCERHRLPDRQ